MLKINSSLCQDFGKAVSREWLETNGLGGFAAGTIIGLNTRRYHGLLVAATQPPAGRYVLLSKLEETLVIDGERVDLSANQYGDVVHPEGYRYLQEFRLEPFPIFIYRVDGVEIEKTIFMIHGENSTVIQYQLKSRGPHRDIGLELRPLTAFRDYHRLTRENGAINAHVEVREGEVSLMPYPGLPGLFLAHNAGEIEPTGHWYRNFEYAFERERGFDYQEDLFNPLLLRFDVGQGITANVIASVRSHDVKDAAGYRSQEQKRRQAILSAAPVDSACVRQLCLAADQFIVQRGDEQTIVAGYPWFIDWGRDAMIALPGLTLSAGRPDAAKKILLNFAKHVSRGMLPNRFPENGGLPEYHTVDATLWFFEAARAFLQHTRDYAFVKEELYRTFKDIIRWHEEGTRYGIYVDDDGLLDCGETGVQLTWMDTRAGGGTGMPRQGKPVEIQALWYNALRIMESLADVLGDRTNRTQYEVMAEKTAESFNRIFWNREKGFLYDAIDGGRRDASLRPNQIFAVSLPYGMLPPDKAQRVVKVVEHTLLTPVGLKSLSSDDPRYKGKYEGGPDQRDGAYHQGTVWPWLMGPFITAYRKAYGPTPQVQVYVEQWLKNFEHHLLEACLGQVSEIFDADFPYHPRGCPAQAWSVAELLRVSVDVKRRQENAAGHKSGLPAR